MKKSLLLIFLLTALFAVAGHAQDKPEKLPIDDLLEADAIHNLDVAWQYFKTKKAYMAVLMRTEETMAAHPGFSKMDEIFYLSGMSSYLIANGKGKQKVDLKTMSEDDIARYDPKRLNEDAFAYLSKLVEEFPESKYVKKAQETLKKIKVEDGN